MSKGKKPIKKEEKNYGILSIQYYCPRCKNDVGAYHSEIGMCFEDKFRREFGQKIDWSDEK